MRRSLGSEALRVATVLAVPAALAFVLPYGAFTFRASAPAARGPAFVAFVTLDAEAERSALKKAKASLRDESSRVRWMRADLSFGELPEEPQRPVLPSPGRENAPEPGPVAFGVPAYRPSQAAETPRKVPAAPAAAPAPAFSREELLRIE